MCGFYDDKQKIKKGDKAIYNNEEIEILKATHIKENRTMDIFYIDKKEKEYKINIPYQTAGFGLNLLTRDL